MSYVEHMFFECFCGKPITVSWLLPILAKGP